MHCTDSSCVGWARCEQTATRTRLSRAAPGLDPENSIVHSFKQSLFIRSHHRAAEELQANAQGDSIYAASVPATPWHSEGVADLWGRGRRGVQAGEARSDSAAQLFLVPREDWGVNVLSSVCHIQLALSDGDWIYRVRMKVDPPWGHCSLGSSSH